MLETAILNRLQKLPKSLQQEVLHYIEFLVTRYGKSVPEEEPIQKRQGFGIWKGKITISEDFNELL